MEAFLRWRGYEPLTDRLVRAIGSRRLTLVVFASLPFVHLLAFWWVRRATGLTSVGPEGLLEFVPNRILNAYLVLLGMWAAQRFSARLADVASAVWATESPRASWLTWFLPPVLLAALNGVPTELSHISADGLGRAAAAPSAYMVSAVISFFVRIPVMTAFWTAIVVLAFTMRLGREGRLGSFPEDRSLGLKPVGDLVFEVFAVYTAAFVPVFALQDMGIFDFLWALAVFLGGVGLMLFAVWELHRRMTETRRIAVAAARVRYAAAYRAAEATPSKTVAWTSLSTAGALLSGAESIHEWPFDERTQRMAAVVVTGVVTSLAVRLILLGAGI